MKGKAFLLIIILMMISLTGTSTNNITSIYDNLNFPQDTVIKIKDGIYEGKSQSIYTDEPYWGIIKLKVNNGVFSEVKFIIRDSLLHEYFDGKYEKHFAGNPVYVEQSRNDWKGVQKYPGKLTGKKGLNEVDAMSGATWSYNIFKSSVQDALKSQK